MPRHGLAVRQDGTVFAWGDNEAGQASPPPDLINIVQVSAGGSHSLALTSTGTVLAWGSDDYGESTAPPGLDKVLSIAAGPYGSYAVRTDGSVATWGYASTPPSALAPIASLAPGSDHVVAVTRIGGVVAWGFNDFGQTSVPAGLTNVVAVAAGYYHSLALTASGTVMAWGSNSHGQATVPTGLTNVVAIAAGANTSAALLGDGTVVSWGATLGSPPLLANVTAIASGIDGVVALRESAADTAPGFATQPVSQLKSVGQDTIFSAEATGSPAPAYQWFKDGVELIGKTQRTITLTNLTPADAGRYFVRASNPSGAATSSTADLVVYSPPTITAHPVSQSALIGSSITLSITATGFPPPTYQWLKNGVPLSGATASTLTLSALTPGDAADYTVVVSNPARSVTSSTAKVSLLTPPTITTQPVSQSINTGTIVTFSVASASYQTPTYQWFLNGNAITGATAINYTITSANLTHAGLYSVRVTNPAGTTTSTTATLVVQAQCCLT